MKNHKTKKRIDSFFGLHFDFHATRDTKEVGCSFQYDWIDELLKTVKPDFVQCDAKGHYGIASYPTKCGPSVPEIKTDILRAWRELTRKNGVALYAHYSGIYDSAAMEEHPEWAVVTESGESDLEHASVFGGYLDGKMLPQLKELALDYGLDGAWVDGDCWACRLDFGENAKKAFEKEYKRAPDFEKDRELYREFCRRGYWEYVKRYVNEMRKARPDFQVISNWAMSSQSPYADKEKLPLEFLSGDLTWIDSIDNGARFESRFMAQNGLPWDMMSWGFVLWDTRNGYVPSAPKLDKVPIQICQELSHTLALGGGTQIYFRQSPQRGIYDRDTIKVAEQVVNFCRERQPFCHKKNPVRETCLLFCAKEYYDEIGDTMFTARKPYMEDFRITNNALLDNGYHVSFSILEKARI